MADRDQLAELAALADLAGAETTRGRADRALRARTPPLMPDDDEPDEPGAPTPTIAQTALSWAFGYRTEHDDHRPSSRVSFRPFLETSFGQLTPPPVPDVPSDIVDAWEQLAEHVSTPWALARLNHLLFVARRGNGRQRATTAIRSYLDAAKHWTREFDQTADLRIALSLLRAVPDADLREEVVEHILQRIANWLADPSDDKPGILLAHLELLADNPETPARYDAFLDAALGRTANDPWLADRVLRLRRARSDTDEACRSVDADRVGVWMRAADSSEGLVRQAHLKKALQTAEGAGLTDLGERAAAAMQATDKDTLGLMTISASTSISEEDIEQIIAPILDQDSWPEALTAFALYGPVTGDTARNREQVAEQARTFVLSTLLRGEILGGDGLPRYAAQNDDDQAEIALCRHEQHHIRSWAPFIAEALRRMPQKYGIPPLDEITAYLSDMRIVTAPTAAVLARSLHRYWTQDYEGAAFTAMPQVETLARSLVVAMDAGVYRLQRDQRPGQYPGLGSLLGELRKRGLDESWYRFFHSTFTGPAGANLRNEMAHGFVDYIGAPLSAVIIQAALHLAHRQPSQPETTGDAAAS